MLNMYKKSRGLEQNQHVCKTSTDCLRLLVRTIYPYICSLKYKVKMRELIINSRIIRKKYRIVETLTLDWTMWLYPLYL